MKNGKEECIPTKWITNKSNAHPWINSDCQEALRAKHEARGTETFIAARNHCSFVFLRTYFDYIIKTRDKLKSLGLGSRGWWKIANSLLTKAGSAENISVLQRTYGTWAMDPEERANELAETFRSQAQLLPLFTNAYTPLIEHPTGSAYSSPLCIQNPAGLR